MALNSGYLGYIRCLSTQPLEGLLQGLGRCEESEEWASMQAFRFSVNLRPAEASKLPKL